MIEEDRFWERAIFVSWCHAKFKPRDTEDNIRTCFVELSTSLSRGETLNAHTRAHERFMMFRRATTRHLKRSSSWNQFEGIEPLKSTSLLGQTVKLSRQLWNAGESIEPIIYHLVAHWERRNNLTYLPLRRAIIFNEIFA